jgi:hypothetical protein
MCSSLAIPLLSPDDPTPAPEAPLLGRELGGDLPCVVCGYNLRGLSIRSMCPECGTLVRATILSIVDPLAGELRPIERPHAIAIGLLMWAGGAVVVALMCWLPQAADLLRIFSFNVARPDIALGVSVGVLASAIGSLALIKPHDGVPRSTSLLALLGTLLYAPLLIAQWNYHVATDAMLGPQYFAGWSPTPGMTRDLLVSSVLTGAIILCQRPAARLLVARCLAMRTGRVDRQTLYAMALAAVVMAAGSALGPVARTHIPVLSEVGRIAGVSMIAIGAVLLTIGVFGSLIDAARIAQAVVFPSPTVRQVIREGRPGAKSRVGRMLDATGRTPTEPDAPAKEPGA